MGMQEIKKPVMTYRVHAVVANLLVTVIDAKAFSHLTQRLEEDKYVQRTGGLEERGASDFQTY